MAFLELPPEGDLYALIADLLVELLDSDAVLAVSDYDPKAGLFRPKALRGLGNMLEAVRKIIGQDPMELAGDFGPAARRALASGKFTKVESGLSDFSNKLLPAPVAKAVEKLLGLSGFYVVGFAKAGRIEGGLSIVTRKQTTLPEAALLEAFAGQAAVALGQRRAQESFRESESTLRVFINALPGPAILLNREGRILEANESMVRSLGKSRPEIIGQRAFDLLPDKVARGRLERFETAVRTGRSEIFEDSRAGVSYLNYIYPVGDELSGISKVAVIAVDISERKRAEETFIIQRDLAIALGAAFNLREALKLCLEAAIRAGRMDSGGIYLIDRARGTLDLACHQGLSAEFVERSAHFEPEDPHTRLVREGKPLYLPAQELQPPFAEPLLREGLRVLAIVPVRHDDRIIACLNVASRALEDISADDRIYLETIAAQIGNAISRKQAEAELRISEERYQGFIESADEAIVVVQEGMIKFVNPKTSDLIGYSRDELLSMPLTHFIHPDDRPLIADYHRRRIAGEDIPQRYPVRFIDKENAIKWGEVKGVAISWEERPATLNFIDDVTERKRAEEALRKSEERLREAQALGRIGSWEFDLATGKIIWSDEVYALYEREKSLGPPSEEEEARYYPSDQTKMLRDYTRRAAEKGEEFRYDLEARLPIGKTVHFHASMRPVKDERGRIVKLFGTVQDITERKRAEETIRTNEAQLSNALRMAHAGHWEYDVAGDIFTFNDNFYRIFRTTAEEVGGYKMSSAEYARRFCHPDDMHMVQEEVQASIKTDDPYYARDLEHRILYADGEVGSIAVRFFIVKDSQGRTVKTYGVNQDITERKRAEDNLRESETRYRGLVQNSLMGIGLSQGNRVVFANPALLNIFGYSNLEEFVRIPLLDHVAPAAREAIIERMQKAEAGEYTRADFEYNILRKNGTERTLHAWSTHIILGEEKFTQTVFQDITEQKKTEERLRQSAALLRRTLKEAINSLSSAIEMRDPYTAGHQEKVTRLSVAIASEMDLSEESIEALQIAGIVHDIGKLGIPAEILSKPDKLAEIEFALIKTHAEIGYRILNKIEFPWPIAQIVYQHHERINGSGYPRGLSGSDLLIEAKILSVADTVEAMSSHRPYRAALGIEAALREISDKRGVLYSPEVVEACLKLFAENKFRF
jgi:PAS domain S-box-containing protein/putative nucleotidyltransferase with HDIG domain